MNYPLDLSFKLLALANQVSVKDAQGTGNELKDRVGGQILELELTDAAQRERAEKVLAGVGCGDPKPGERADQLTLPAPRDGLELVEDAAAQLRRAGIGVSELGLRRPTLDDVFLQLTGTPPQDDGTGPQSSVAAPSSAIPGSTRIKRTRPRIRRHDRHPRSQVGHRAPPAPPARRAEPSTTLNGVRPLLWFRARFVA